ncbi:putative sagittal suture morphogenesis [Trypoxylus dichotomus]
MEINVLERCRIYLSHRRHNGTTNMPITWKLVHDNDPKHSIKSVKDTAIAKSISVISWPACSPDLNPIESSWYAVKKKVGELHYSSLDKLDEAIELLVEAINTRCRAVIDSKGFPKKY